MSILKSDILCIQASKFSLERNDWENMTNVVKKLRKQKCVRCIIDISSTCSNELLIEPMMLLKNKFSSGFARKSN